MTLASKEKSRSLTPSRWATAWQWMTRPPHHRAVHDLRVAAQSGDNARLESLLNADVAVVVESGETDDPKIRMVNGAYDAVALLRHGLAEQPGLVVVERAVNGQAGLVLRRYNRQTAAVTVDFTGRLIGSVWIRLDPRVASEV